MLKTIGLVFVGVVWTTYLKGYEDRIPPVTASRRAKKERGDDLKEKKKKELLSLLKVIQLHSSDVILVS